MERLEEIAKRKAELRSLLESDQEVDFEKVNAEIDALALEERSIKDALEAEERKAKEDAEERRKLADEIGKGNIKPNVIEERKGEKTMEIEKRNTAEYVEAFAEFVKRGSMEAIGLEQRTLLTENATSGTIAIPELVLDEVKTAWENEGIMSLVRKVNLKGNLKVNFERSAGAAVVHTEGSGAVSEEELVEGIVTLIPAHIKKWISISDEVMSLRGEAFLRYIYAELTHKIVKKMADVLVGKLAALPATNTATSVSANKVSMNPAAATIATAIANLSDEASNPVIIMNKLTYAAFKSAQYANGYGVDVFEGCKVLFNNTLPAFSAASTGNVYAIVGDLGYGALANFPNGETVEFTFDEYSRKKEDLVEVLGKEYVAVEPVADKAFCLLAKAAA